MKQFFKVFTPAYLQVCLVCANGFFLASMSIEGVILASFFISFLWTSNVKAALGTLRTKMYYCSGASLGGGTGLVIASVYIQMKNGLNFTDSVIKTINLLHENSIF